MAKSEPGAIWAACAHRCTPHLIGGALYRMVENQEQVATRDLVGSDLEKQAVLEELLEPSKPPRPPGTEHLDYLLATPWRYPPLRHGSRFGRRHEPSLFYAGTGPAVTLAESAYYRWVFLLDMESPPPRALRSQHTLYEARYRTERGLRLQHVPWSAFEAKLTHKSDYTATQTLGSAMRAAGIAGFEYRSARDPEGGNNVALFNPAALASTTAGNRQPWLCSTSGTEVVFSCIHQPPLRRFRIGDFLLEGRFPAPA